MAQVATKRKQEAEEIINSVLSKEPIVENNVPDGQEQFTVRVTRLAMNRRFVYAVLDGMLIEVFYPRYRENSVGRIITVVKADEIGEKKYKLVQ